MAEEISLEDIRRMAVAAGLTRLTDEHLQQLLRAARTAQQRRMALPAGSLAFADDPAHVFHVDRHVRYE